MNGSDLFSLSPLVLIAGTSILVMLAIATWRKHWLTLCMTLVGIAAALELCHKGLVSQTRAAVVQSEAQLGLQLETRFGHFGSHGLVTKVHW